MATYIVLDREWIAGPRKGELDVIELPAPWAKADVLVRMLREGFVESIEQPTKGKGSVTVLFVDGNYRIRDSQTGRMRRVV